MNVPSESSPGSSQRGGEAPLSRRARAQLAVQRLVALCLAPVTTVVAFGLLRGWLGLRLEAAGEVRLAYREARRASNAPLLVCGNHLTLIDSAMIAWALGSPAWYVAHPSSLAWNVPEQQNFASTGPRRIAAYVYKCLPILRGGDRLGVADTLTRFAHLLRIGEVGLVFPEAGRSRTGRVEVESAAYGVGRIVRNVPGCRVLCVYLRGDRQQSHSDFPARGDRLRTSLALLEPKSDHAGLRGSRDIARQITQKLAELEQEYFDGRG